MKELIKNNKFAAALIVISLLTNLFLISSMTEGMISVPACLYGCTGWLAQGMTKDIINNPGNFEENMGINYDGSLNIMPKFYAYAQYGMYSIFGPIFGWEYLESWKSTFAYSYIMYILFFFILLYLFYIYTKNIFASLLATLLLHTPGLYMGYKSLVIVFIFSYAAYFFYFIRKFKSITKSYVGIILLTLGLIVLFNMHPTIPFILGFFAIALFLNRYWNVLMKKDFAFLKDKRFHIFVLIFVIAGVISLLTPWWHAAVFEIGGSEAQKLKLNDSIDLAQPSLFFSYIWVFFSSLFPFSSLSQIILSILSLFGIFFLLFGKLEKYNMLRNFTITYLLLYFITSYHYLFTLPVLGIDFAPDKAYGLVLNSMKILLALYGFLFLENIVREKISYGKTTTYAVYAVLIVIALLFSIGKINTYMDGNSYANSQDRSISEVVYLSVYEEYLEPNGINPADTIMVSTNEIATALNVVTGTQVINGRYAHYYRFMDYQPYWFDTAVILYSNNSEARRETLQKYLNTGKDVYVFWDFYWPRSEYHFDNSGRYAGSYFNPIKFVNQSYKERLDAHGIEYFEDHQSFEPNTYGRDQYREFDLLVLSPENYRSVQSPWNEDLEDVMEEVWSYGASGQKLARLYKVDLESPLFSEEDQ